MNIFQIPAENGLGKTKGTALAPEILALGLESSKLSLKDLPLPLQQETIFQEASKALASEEQTLFIGGDHSISYPLVNAFLKYCNSKNQEPFLIVFDAHPDCMPPMKEPTHEEWLSAIINTGFPTKNIILIGIRKIESEEKQFLEKHKIKTLSLDQIQEILDLAKNKTCYISLDIDSIDPDFAPATGYPEPKGLQKLETLEALKDLKEKLNLKALDLVEINPTLSGSQKTLDLGRQIIKLFNN